MRDHHFKIEIMYWLTYNTNYANYIDMTFFWIFIKLEFKNENVEKIMLYNIIGWRKY